MSNKSKKNRAIQQQRMNDAVQVDEKAVEAPNAVLESSETENEPHKEADAVLTANSNEVDETKEVETLQTVEANAETISTTELNPEDLEDDDETDETETESSIISAELNPNPVPELSEDMQAYFEAYPDNDVFYKTSDGQVFLKNSKQWAEAHENKLGGELKTIKRQ